MTPMNEVLKGGCLTFSGSMIPPIRRHISSILYSAERINKPPYIKPGSFCRSTGYRRFCPELEGLVDELFHYRSRKLSASLLARQSTRLLATLFARLCFLLHTVILIKRHPIFFKTGAVVKAVVEMYGRVLRGGNQVEPWVSLSPHRLCRSIMRQCWKLHRERFQNVGRTLHEAIRRVCLNSLQNRSLS